MNWDEAIIAGGEEYSNQLGECGAFMDGAGWVLHELRSYATLERVARAIARLDPGEEWPDETIIDDEHRQECFNTARTAIGALLGEDQ